MELGDVTVFTDHTGKQRVAIVVAVLEDGRLSVFCPNPTWAAVSTSGQRGVPNTAYDPTIPPPAEETVPVSTEGSTALFKGDALSVDGTTNEEGLVIDHDGTVLNEKAGE